MKITSKIIAALAITAAFTSASLAGVSVTRDTDIKDFAINSVDGSAFHFGVHVEGGTYGMEYKGRDVDIDASRYVGFLGYDISRSVTLFATMGTMVSETDGAAPYSFNSDNNSSFTFGFGVMANLIDANQFEFLSTISRYRVQAEAEVYFADFEDYSWTEFDAAITFQLHNEDAGNHFQVLPNEYALFAGPCVSIVSSDDLDQTSGGMFGIKGGVSLIFTGNTYLTGGFEYYGDTSLYYGTIGVRF